jgi:uncharacterized protein YjiS (DUF1127 family)
MAKMIRKWLRVRRYIALARQLKAMPARELQALGIQPTEIDRLARAASEV